MMKVKIVRGAIFDVDDYDSDSDNVDYEKKEKLGIWRNESSDT